MRKTPEIQARKTSNASKPKLNLYQESKQILAFNAN
jgi:hypothetical protein